MIRPLRNKILFVFLQGITGKNNMFEEKTKWGFQLKENPSDSATKPRWGLVLSAGNEVGEECQKGQYILVKNLMWTPGFKHDGVTIWQTEETHVLAYTNEKPIIDA